jgi:hypothetical protein
MYIITKYRTIRCQISQDNSIDLQSHKDLNLIRTTRSVQELGKLTVQQQQQQQQQQQ